MPRLQRRAVLVCGSVLGLALWLLPALFLGLEEPWDSDGPGYLLALFGSGLVLGFFGPGQTGAAVCGVFSGQLLALLGRVVSHPATSELWVVGAALLAGFSLVGTGLGALAGSALRRWRAPV